MNELICSFGSDEMCNLQSNERYQMNVAEHEKYNISHYSVVW